MGGPSGNANGSDSMKRYWEIIARNLKKRGWSYGYVSALNSQGRTVWIADAHRGDGKRFVVRADEKLTAFLELEAAIRGGSPSAAAAWLRTERSDDLLLNDGTNAFVELFLCPVV